MAVCTNGAANSCSLAIKCDCCRPTAVRPFVQRNKTDAADTQAIWTAGQQVVLTLHRFRAQLMKMRIMQTDELRGLPVLRVQRRAARESLRVAQGYPSGKPHPCIVDEDVVRA